MVDQKLLVIKLFFNTSNQSFYVQIGEHCLFIVKDKSVTNIQEKEGINIIHVKDVREIQQIQAEEKN